MDTELFMNLTYIWKKGERWWLSWNWSSVSPFRTKGSFTNFQWCWPRKSTYPMIQLALDTSKILKNFLLCWLAKQNQFQVSHFLSNKWYGRNESQRISGLPEVEGWCHYVREEETLHIFGGLHLVLVNQHVSPCQIILSLFPEHINYIYNHTLMYNL